MQNKLQELTDKLYNEGLSKGKKEAEDMKIKAQKEAETIISQANAQAKQIVEKAQKEASELKTKVNNDLKMASTQAVSVIKQQAVSAIIAKSVNSPVKDVMSDREFLKSVISTIVKSFNASNPDSVGLELILPASMQKDLNTFITNEITSKLSKGIDVTFDKGTVNGFKIGPKDGGYLISFAESDFKQLIGQYLRPATKKLLFGE